MSRISRHLTYAFGVVYRAARVAQARDIGPAAAGSLQIVTSRTGGAVTIKARGELDIATAPRLAGVVNDDSVLLAAAVLLDLSAVTFVDSSGLHALIAIHEALGNRLQIAPGAACLRVARLAGVADQLPLAS